MFKNRIYLISALATLVLALGAAWIFLVRPGPGTARGLACIWDSNDLQGKPDTCEGQCATLYFGGIKNGFVMKGKLMHACCSKGYTVVADNDPITHETRGVFCRKDGP
jgi:hypothetical protein